MPQEKRADDEQSVTMDAVNRDAVKLSKDV